MKKQFLDLGKQPIANGFLYKEEIKDEFFFDLKVGFDEETKLVTQIEYVDPPLMFNENYAYCLEDVELSVECLKRGKKNYYIDYAKCIHYEGVTKMQFLDMVQDPVRYNHDYTNRLEPYIKKNIKHIKKYVVVLDKGEVL